MEEGQEFDYREYTPQDCEELQQLQLKLFPIQYTKSFYEELNDTQTNQSILCIEKSTNKIVGVCSTKIMHEYIFNCFHHLQYNYGYIMTLGVSNLFRRKGIASKMIMITEERMLTNHNCKLLSLHCKVDNDSAISFYNAHGFHIENREYGYYTINKRKEDAYVLNKVLDEKFFKTSKNFVVDCCERIMRPILNCWNLCLDQCCGCLWDES
jgi:ribosomal protein S18 acetylase RimI-like enzyme